MSMLTRLIPALLLTVTGLLHLPVHAEEAVTLRYNQVSLQAQAQRDVVHDLMRVTLYSEAQGSDPARLAAQTTRVLNAATVQARQVAGITLQTGGRTSYPVHDKDGRRIMAWRERAELHLESTDFAALAALTAALQETLTLESRQFMISRSSRKAHENSLLQEAIAAFGERARLAVQALGGTAYRLVNLELNSDGFRALRQVRMAQPMMVSVSADMAESQQIEAGTSSVAIIAAGVIEVQM